MGLLDNGATSGEEGDITAIPCDYCFYNLFNAASGITSVNIPKSIVRLDYGICNSCENLISVTIPESVKSISWYVFNDCKNLNEINYNGTMEQWSLIWKAEEWHKNVPATVVHCIDGDVPLD